MTDQKNGQQKTMPEVLWKRSDLERMFQLTGRSISDHVKTGKIPAPIIVGRSRRWRMSDIEEFIQGSQTIEY